MSRHGVFDARWRMVGRAAAVVFAVLSTVVVIVGCVLVQFDDQYDASGVAGRLLAGVFGGLFAAAIYSPLTAVVSLCVGGVVALMGRLRSSVSER